jgi:hypothetical protein
MRKVILLLALTVILVNCTKENELKLLVPHKKFVDHVTRGDSYFYAVTKPDNSQTKKKLAIGVFDSGIGGLTVFDAIVNADFFNTTHENQPDGIKDFDCEQFIYLADQANMPYSNYVEEGKKICWKSTY